MIRYGPRRGLAVKPPPGAARLDWSKPLTRGLVAAWELVEGGGAALRDLVTGIPATASGGPTWTTGRYGAALQFASASTQYVPTRDIDLDYVTIAAWVRSTSASNANAVIGNKNYDGANVPYQLSLGMASGAGDGFAFYSGGWNSSGVTTDIRNDGREHLVAGTFDGTTLGYWLDGRLDASTTIGATVLPKNNNVLDIGRYANNTWYFDGDIGFVLLWNRALTAAEVRQLAADPLGSLLWQPRVRLATGTIAVQYLRPASDVATGTWTPVPASPTTLYTKLDEATPDDADYDYSATYPASDVMTVALSSATDPVSSSGHVVRYRYRNNTGGGQGTLLVELLQGASTVIASWTHTGITSSAWVQANQTLSGVQADAVTDYADLRLRFTASVG